MTHVDPSNYAWWLASRASGIVALVLITASVGLGLAMASKVVRKRGAKPVMARVHEHTALAGLIAIAVHGVTLLGDPWLNPGVNGLLIPFTMRFEPVFTGLGIVAAYLAAALGLSFYARRRIGPKLWRKAHRATVVVYLLALVHTLGAGTDSGSSLLRAFMLSTGVPIAWLFVARLRSAKASAPERPAARQPHRPLTTAQESA